MFTYPDPCLEILTSKKIWLWRWFPWDYGLDVRLQKKAEASKALEFGLGLRARRQALFDRFCVWGFGIWGPGSMWMFTYPAPCLEILTSKIKSGDGASEAGRLFWGFGRI